MTNEIPSTETITERAIPLELPSVAGWKEVLVRENNEPLVALGPFSSNDEIFTDSIYFGERSDSPYSPNPPEGSLITMFVRQEVAQQLKEAQKLLPNEHYLIVFDTFRTLEVQQSLFDVYFNALKEQQPDWSEDQLLTETQKYVSLPSTDSAKPSPHNTGGSVDLAIFKLPQEIDTQVHKINQELREIGDNWQHAYELEMQKITLIRENAHLLDFGTPFDWGDEKAALNYFETKTQETELTTNEIKARKSRRLLFNVMSEAGFEPYQDEWWHFNSPKSQMGAITAGLSEAMYGATNLSEENFKQEQMRSDQRLGTIRILNGWKQKIHTKGSPNPLSEYFEVAKKAASETGDPRITSLPEAVIMAPSEA